MTHLTKTAIAFSLFAAGAFSQGCGLPLRNRSHNPLPSQALHVATVPAIPSDQQAEPNPASNPSESQAIVKCAPVPQLGIAADPPNDSSIPAIQASLSNPVAQENLTHPEPATSIQLNRLALNIPTAGSYVIETGDSLEVKIRGTPELDEQVTVRPDGMVSLQIVGDVIAAGLTPEALRLELKNAYSPQLNDPEIVVIVRSFSGNSIYIGGEVYAPGRVALTGRVTALKAVILAGGFKDTADQRRVVVRHGDGSCCEYDLKSVLECKGGHDIQLQPYDMVYVPKSQIAKVNLFVEQYIDKVLPFSRSFGIFVSHNTGLTSAVGGGP